jgi:hypothetical protein
VRGSPARKLHYAILDALEPTSRDMFGRKTSKKSVMYVGRGARSYSMIGAWAPSGLVALMMGYSSGNGNPSDTPSGSETN